MSHLSLIVFAMSILIFFNFIYLFIQDRHRERGRDTGRGRSGSMQGARCGTRSRVSRIMPWAEGRRQTAEPPRDSLYIIPSIYIIFRLYILYSLYIYYIIFVITNMINIILEKFSPLRDQFMR